MAHVHTGVRDGSGGADAADDEVAVGQRDVARVRRNAAQDTIVFMTFVVHHTLSFAVQMSVIQRSRSLLYNFCWSHTLQTTTCSDLTKTEVKVKAEVKEIRGVAQSPMTVEVVVSGLPISGRGCGRTHLFPSAAFYLAWQIRT